MVEYTTSTWSTSDDKKTAKKTGKSNVGAAASLLGLFEPPAPPPIVDEKIPQETLEEHVRSTLVHSNHLLGSNDSIPHPPPPLIHDPELERLFLADQSPLLARGTNSNNNRNYSSCQATAKQNNNERSPLLFRPHQNQQQHADDKTPKTGVATRKTIPVAEQQQQQQRPSLSKPPKLPSIREINTAAAPLNDATSTNGHDDNTSWPTSSSSSLLTTMSTTLNSALRTIGTECAKPTTWIGSFMYLLFQVVFSLTMGAAITRPYAQTSLLGVMTKMAALGIMFSASTFWIHLSHDIPALYPTVDLFSAPFLANIAALIDQDLHNDPAITTPQENDEYFLASFSFLAVLSLVLSGTLLVLASVFKLANLASYLPFPVLCGFFAAVGVLTWTLAFTVDNNGVGVGAVLAAAWSGGDENWRVVQHAICHHVPTCLVAALMKYLGPKNPTYVVAVSLGTISLFYTCMFVFDISMEEMIQAEWFWSSSELRYESTAGFGFQRWAPPAPFGWINSLVGGKVKWSAVRQGLDTTIALSFLYLIRCSLHGAALKKNVPNLQRIAKNQQDNHHNNSKKRNSLMGTVMASFRNNNKNKNGDSSSLSAVAAAAIPRPAPQVRSFSEVVDIEHIMPPDGATSSNYSKAAGGSATSIERAKATNIPLNHILIQYGYSQFWCALAGGFAVTPSVAASSTMYVLRAEHVAPQIGSVILLFFFYMTNFELVGFIPKPAFSSLLVLAFYDMIGTWFIKSYFKTKEKLEWLVVPAIVVFAFVIGLLQAVFLGLAMSTFLFVAAFFRSGVVKFVSNGVNVRSTIERPVSDARWLDQNGDLIQILVLQNYLFFGNASSIESYISTMFEDPTEDGNAADPLLLPPLPKVIILDLTLVTGSDTSAVDAFSDILVLCGNYGCKLFLAGVSPSLRQVMYLGGVKPETTLDRTKRKLRFFPDLDSAVGKAEDMLLESEMGQELVQVVRNETGFQSSLRSIDEQHETTALKDLVGLQEYVQAMELAPGEILYGDQHCDRGIHFIEQGVLKTERDTDLTVSRLGGDAYSRLADNGGTLNGMVARTGSIGKATTELRATDALSLRSNFRIARVGPGWVIGAIECLSEVSNKASTVAVTPCRLHHLSFKKIKEVEESQPLLVLRLYKLLASLMAKQQELTIGQLGTLHAIMSAPAQKKPLGRGTSSGGMRHTSSQSSLG